LPQKDGGEQAHPSGDVEGGEAIGGGGEGNQDFSDMVYARLV
jgi:hypothetical protein